MIVPLIKRIVRMLLTMWIVYTICFAMLRVVPGGPFSGDGQTSIDHYRTDAPLHEQYGVHLWNTLHGDFGPSTANAVPIRKIIARGLPFSASMIAIGLTFSLLLGSTAGIAATWRSHRQLDAPFVASASVALIATSLLAGMIGAVACVSLMSLVPVDQWSQWTPLLLPSLCLGAVFAGYNAKSLRDGVRDTVDREYVRAAACRGVSQSLIAWRYVLPHAIRPMTARFGTLTVGVAAGSLVMERAFALPGLWSPLSEAVARSDYPTLVALILVYTLMLLTMHAVVKGAFWLIAPRKVQEAPS
jgi:oligopeptide transport system permease protein